MTTATVDLEHEYPSIPLAYEFVRPAYDVAQQRMDAADRRLQHLVTVAAGLGSAGAVLGRAVNEHASFTSVWFLAAMAVLAVVVAGGLVARGYGPIRAAHPTVLYQRWLHKAPWEFQKDMVYFAGEDFHENVRRIGRKARIADGLTVALVLLLACLTAWVING